MRNKILLLSFILFSFAWLSCKDNIRENKKEAKVTAVNLYDFKVKDINNNDFDMSSLRGKKVMIVNVASRCGNTPQYAELQRLYHTYKNKNFVIIGFPSNDFLEQEPGTNEEIKQFCTSTYGVTFPMMSKISVTGKNIAPIYEWLTQFQKKDNKNSEVEWNFQKFLINEKGEVIDVIPPSESIISEKVKKWIEN